MDISSLTSESLLRRKHSEVSACVFAKGRLRPSPIMSSLAHSCVPH